MSDRIKKIAEGLLSMAVFRGLLEDPVMEALVELLLAEDGEESLKADCWGEFVSELYAQGGNLSAHIRDIVLDSENPYIRTVAAGKKVPAGMEAAFRAEIGLLAELSQMKPWELKALLGFGQNISLPEWETEPLELEELYADRAEHIAVLGYGMFASHHMFSMDEDGLAPVPFYDKKGLADLIGYERERAKIIENTEALLGGLPTNNVLLYGDAGTGKSSTVKAIANEYADRGLRLIEVKKKYLYRIPAVIERLSEDPLKFILFIDDLSFSSNDDDFAALKAILEGSVAGGSKNIAVYATSNRRHFLKETAEDRAGDDLHLYDTIQENLSLAARFGLQVTFAKPDKELYVDIVQKLAVQSGILAPDADEEAVAKLVQEAEAYAIRNGGRSPRAAKNFVTGLLAQQYGEE